MRTTLTIEDSILAELKEESFRSGLPLKTVINKRLQLGLRVEEKQNRTDEPYKSEAFHMGKAYFNLDKAMHLAGQLEDEEISRKMELRK